MIPFFLLYSFMGEGQNFEQRNVERTILRNFKIANIKIMEDEFFDSYYRINIFIFEKLF